MSVLMQELETRWQGMFMALAAGADVAPATRLRAEGLMEALVLQEAHSAEELQARMAQVYRDTTGVDLADSLGADWQAFFVFPQIPAMGQRAPVYPGAAD